MKMLDHSKIYYKGLGQATEEECTKNFNNLVGYFVAFTVLMIASLVILILGCNSNDLGITDGILFGVSIGLTSVEMFDCYQRINRYKLRLSEFEEGEEE